MIIIGKNSETEQKSSKNLSQYEAATPSTEGSYSSKNSRPQSRALARDWRAENFYVIFAKSSRVLTIVSFCSVKENTILKFETKIIALPYSFLELAPYRNTFLIAPPWWVGSASVPSPAGYNPIATPPRLCGT